MRMRVRMLLLVAVLLLSPASVSASCQLLAPDNQLQVEEHGLSFSWRVSGDLFELQMSSSNLHAGQAWLAFGFSESGGMVGADIVTVEFSSALSAAAVDRFVPWAAAPLEASPLPYPVPDTVQDWELLCSDMRENLTTAVVRRKLDTGDDQDRPVVDGLMSAIYAWGAGPLGYHGSQRGSIIVDFLGSSSSSVEPFTPPSDADASFVKGFSPGYNLSAIDTQYICQVHDVGTAPRHVVAIEQIYSEVESYGPYIHHVLVHACGNDLSALNAINLYEDKAFPCRRTDPTATGNSPSAAGPCTAILYGGAVGGGPFVLPDEAGLLLGSEVRYIVVEAHLDNPNLDTGPIVTDIVKFHTTSTLRTYHAGSMVVGDPAIFLDNIASGVKDAHFETTCPSECTELIESDRHIFSSFLHMHQVGRTIWTSLLKYNTEDDGTKTLSSKNIYDYREYWNFGFQELTEVDIVLSAGDQINTHCIYDTTKRTTDVEFSQASTDEMCMSFLFYYPYLPTDGYFCGYYSSDSSLCGHTSNIQIFSGPNPDPDGDTTLPDELFVTYDDDDGEDSNSGNESAILAIKITIVCMIGAIIGYLVFVQYRRRRASGNDDFGKYDEASSNTTETPAARKVTETNNILHSETDNVLQPDQEMSSF